MVEVIYADDAPNKPTAKQRAEGQRNVEKMHDAVIKSKQEWENRKIKHIPTNAYRDGWERIFGKH